MILVFATAISTWLLLWLLDTFFEYSFLVDGTIAVIGGVIVGFIASWIIRRQRRQDRRA